MLIRVLTGLTRRQPARRQPALRTGSLRGASEARWAAPLLTIALFLACASAPPVEESLPSAEGYYSAALEKLDGQRVRFFFNDVEYPGAIELLQEVIDNYPYSEYALLAELKIADIHFERGNYEEAESFYQDFVELHPSHEKVPYAIYRNGLCSFRSMRGADQDQTPTLEALEEFRVLIERYPDTDLARDAQTHVQLAEDRLAAVDVDIGDFYFGRGEYHAAILRYRRALTKYPGHSDRVRTLARLATALKHMRQYYEAERLYHQVLEMDPDDDELIDGVRAELADLEHTRGIAVPGVQRSCVTDPNPSCENGAQ